MTGPAEGAVGLVDVVVEAEGWSTALPDLEGIANQAARLALEGAGLDPAGYEICLLACDDDRIAALNAEFRGRPAPTNVLSWPAFELAAEAEGGSPGTPPEGHPGAPVALGDVALALQTTRHEAEVSSIPLKDHVLHLILHGCLHLLGYDHLREGDAVLMEGIERRQLGKAGVPDPYNEGDAARPRDC